MDNVTRLLKIEKAMALIREVEFSFEENDPNRKDLYRAVVNSFSCGPFGWFMAGLKKSLKPNEIRRYYKRTKSL